MSFIAQLRHLQWMPRLWLGCGARAWWRLLRRYRFAVGWQHLHTAVVDTAASHLNSCLGAVERGVYGPRLRRLSLREDPLFVLGHWRTGTSLLHQVLCLDARHAGPTIYECLSPHHFLLTEDVVPKLIWFLLPETRRVDAMQLDWTSAFEDEFALCLLGARSPYESIAFPNSGGMRLDLFNPRTLTPAEARYWRAALVQFVRKLTLRHAGQRLVLKSPPHMCRIPQLLELFPRARFVHIVRNPFKVFRSTLHLWRTLHRTQGLQNPRYEPSKDIVFATFLHLYGCLDRDRALIPAGQFHELRYENLIRNPIKEMRQIYERLELGDFEAARPQIDRYFLARGSYATNRYELSAGDRQAIGRRWRAVIERYGYDEADAISSAPSSPATT